MKKEENLHMKKFDRILDGLKYKSPLPVLFENGYTPEAIKKEIHSSFAPFLPAPKVWRNML